MSRKTVGVTIALLLCLSVAGGVLTCYLPAALAQNDAPAAEAEAEPETEITKLLTPSPVVTAIPYQSRTDYEQDPFEPGRVRRTSTTVVQVLLVRADGTTEIKASK